MMRGNKSADTVDIEQVRTRFEDWRQSRKGRARLADELWSAAVEVARRGGPSGWRQPDGHRPAPGWRKAETADYQGRTACVWA